jgi:hypothetical protein
MMRSKKSQAARFPSAAHWSSPPIGPLARTQLNDAQHPPSRALQALCEVGHGYECVHNSVSAASLQPSTGLCEVHQPLDRLAFTPAE